MKYNSMFSITQKFLEYNLYFIIIVFLISTIAYIFSKYTTIQSLNQNTIYNFIKYINIISILVSFTIHIIGFYLYCVHLNTLSTNTSNNFMFNVSKINFIIQSGSINSLNFFKINMSIDLFGYLILTLAYLIGFISLLSLDTRLYWKNSKYMYLFNVFILIVYVYTLSSNLIIFFICYELLLLPSFLIVYFVSPSRRSIQAALYFVIWTQLGSLLVLTAISYLISISNIYDLSDIKYYVFTNSEATTIVILLFLGFGFKVPIWPLHYWLTKTHVEAPSGFSIYLSGFLVKTALYGFYKISTSLVSNVDTTIFIVICLMGVVDASLKMWGQTDLKKLVAYGTIQEMNLIYLTFCWGDSYAIISGIIFSVTHAFLSAMMFYQVDCIYRRWHTRSVVEINGLIHVTPNLGISLIIMLIFFSGLPGTIKFISEFYIFGGFLEVSPAACFILMFTANVLGLIGFNKSFLNVIFGLPKKNTKNLPMDLTLKETLIITYCLLFMVLFSYFPLVFF